MLFRIINFLLTFLNHNILIGYIRNVIRSKIFFLRNNAYSKLDAISQSKCAKQEVQPHHQSLVNLDKQLNNLKEPENETSEIKISSSDFKKISDCASEKLSSCFSVTMSNIAPETLSSCALEKLADKCTGTLDSVVSLQVSSKKTKFSSIALMSEEDSQNACERNTIECLKRKADCNDSLDVVSRDTNHAETNFSSVENCETRKQLQDQFADKMPDSVEETDPCNSNATIPLLQRDSPVSSKTKNSNQLSSLANNTDEQNEIDESIYELFQWMEEKIGILKTLPTSSDLSSEDKTVILETVLEDIDLNRKRSFKPKELNSIIKTLEEAATRILEDTKWSISRQRIKDLLSLTKHLSATVGTEVTSEDVKKYINGQKVMDLYAGYQQLRRPLVVQMKAITKYLEYGLEEIITINDEFKEHCVLIDAVCSKDVVFQNLKEMNEKLIAIAGESRDFLMHFENAFNYLLTKNRNFFSLKVKIECLITAFMTTEIKELFKDA